jgi:flagellar motor switch protein FliN/FliY
MSGFTSSAEEVVARCQAGREAIVGAFVRALEVELELKSVEVPSGDPPLAPDDLGPGLLFVLPLGETAALAVLPESSGLVPSWCAKSEDGGASQLRTLAVELGAALFPASLTVDDSQVARLEDLGAGLSRAELPADSACVTLNLASGGKSGLLSIFWPASNPGAALAAGRGESMGHSIKSAAEAAPAAVPDSTRPPPRYRELEEGLKLLPAYSRSLLRIPVPVTVILAESRQPLRAILNIGPGSIINFNKSCEDTLTLEVAGHPFAVGETVKVGDKFGLWITSIILPDERFWVIGGRKPAQRAK